MNDYFKSIRPFNDDEVPKALLQIKDTPLIQAMMAYAFPEDTPAQRVERLLACQKVSDFQVDIMYQVVTKAIEKSITEFTCDGFSDLDPKKGYVFVSNRYYLRYFFAKRCFTRQSSRDDSFCYGRQSTQKKVSQDISNAQ